MRKKAFTLMEIIIVIVVIGILVTVGIPTYQNFIEDSKAKVCETNLKALQAALDVYAMEHDVMPATISELPYEYIKQAYAKILQQKGDWKVKLAYFVVDLQQKGWVYAATLTLSLKDDLAKGDMKLITCPKDPTPPAAGGTSYGINSILARKTSQEYQNIPAGTLLIGDSDEPVFTGASDLSARHRHQLILAGQEEYALGTNIDRETWRVRAGGVATIIPGLSETLSECIRGCNNLDANEAGCLTTAAGAVDANCIRTTRKTCKATCRATYH